MRKRQRSEHDEEARGDAEKYGLGTGSQPIDLLMILARPRGLKARLRAKGMAGEGDYGVCRMSLEKGELLLDYRPDVTLIGELRSQWHEVREAMILLRNQDAGIPYDGKPRHRGGMFDRAIASKFRALRGPHLGRRTAVPRHASPFRPT